MTANISQKLPPEKIPAENHDLEGEGTAVDAHIAHAQAALASAAKTIAQLNDDLRESGLAQIRLMHELRDCEESRRLWKDVAHLSVTASEGTDAGRLFNQMAMRVTRTEAEAAILRHALRRLVEQIGEPVQASPAVMRALHRARVVLEDNAGQRLLADLIALDQVAGNGDCDATTDAALKVTAWIK